MKLPGLAVRNYQLTIVLFALLLVLGTVSFFTMPRSVDPQFNYPAAVIKVVSPGTTPLDIEKLIVDPIESELNELDDIYEFKTNVEDGLAFIRIEFLFNTNPDDKYDDVVTAVSQVRGQLPDSVAHLSVEKLTPSDVNILQVALISEQADYLELKKHAELLEKQLERVSGVRRTRIDALPELEVQIQVEQRKVNALGISLAEIAQAVEQSAQNIPGGYAESGERRFTIRTSGDYENLEQIENTVVRSVGGKIIYLRDIAHVSLTESLPIYKARFNGEKAVFISAVQRMGTQIFDVRKDIDQVLEAYKPRLPEYMRIELALDQSDSVEFQITHFFDNLKLGLALVAIMSLLVLGFKPALVVVVAIPLSIFIAIGWVDLSGFGLNQMSIIGLVIALGMLVDNAIVVVENVGRHLREGKTPKQAAISGSSQVGWAVVSGTLTTILAFVPLIMMQNGPGTFLRAMPVTVVLTLIASLVVALGLTPLLASRLGSSVNSTPYLQRKLQTLADGHYKNVLDKALAKPKAVLGISVLVLVLALALFPMIGVSLFPKAEQPMIFVSIEMPEGTTYQHTDLMASQVENIVNKYDIVKDIATNVGRDNPRVYYNIFPSRQAVNYAQLLVTLHERDLRQVEPFVAQLRQEFNKFTGVDISIKEFMQGPPVAAPVEIRVMGEVLNDIRDATLDVEEIIANTPGTVDVENPISKEKVDLHVDINRDKAALLGIPLSTIDHSIRTALVGSKVGKFRDEEGDEYDLVLRLSEYSDPQLGVFDDIQVPTADGTLVPLLQLATIRPETGIARFHHFSTERMASVTAHVLPEYTTEDVTNAVVEQLEEYAWPAGVYYEIGGEQSSRKEAFGGMAKATAFALMGIFAVLVIQFRSITQPLIVFAAIPFAATGSFLALFIAGYTFSFTAFIGFTSLVGIVVNNSIILVDYTNQMRLEGMSKLEAIASSAHTRFIPIVLTSLTTIGGLIPITLSGSGMWSPLGWVIIGGLTLSTVLTLVVVPVLYTMLSEDKIEQA